MRPQDPRRRAGTRDRGDLGEELLGVRRRKLAKAARKAGLDVGRDQVARLMREHGIRGASRAKNRFTTHADPAAVRAPDLVKRDFTATGPDQL